MPKLTHSDGTQIERYAFIDVYNTEKTARLILNFDIDWERVYGHLTKVWGCSKVFFYAGIAIGDLATESTYKSFENLGYTVRSKTTIPFKKKDKIIQVKCPSCGHDHVETIAMGYENKSNCDVELTVDAIEYAKPNVEMLFFTGDGDFEFLLRNVIAKGAKVYIISNPNKSAKTGYRLSLSLKGMIKKNKATLIDLDSWKMKIKK